MLIDDLYIREVGISKEIPKNNYLSSLPVVQSLRKLGGLGFHRKVTFIVGENGIGKSTLIEGLAVAMGFNPEDGIHSVDYKDTEHYIVTKRFMDAPEKMVEELLG